jgi:hypothetical protein
MDPQFAFEVHKRMEIERTRRWEYERVARERIDAMGSVPRESRRSIIRRWWNERFVARVAIDAPIACCPAAVVCP